MAGVRVATQTPPLRSGQRVVFLSLDDGTDCAFFPDSQDAAGPLLFGARPMVVRGHTRRTGQRGLSIQADQAWDLKALWRTRRNHAGAREAVPPS